MCVKAGTVIRPTVAFMYFAACTKILNSGKLLLKELTKCVRQLKRNLKNVFRLSSSLRSTRTNKESFLRNGRMEHHFVNR